MSDLSCIFCRIVLGVEPKTLLEVGQRAVVFLDKNQAATGHLLVVPKAHASSWHELDELTVAEMSRLARRWAEILVRSFQPDGYNLLLNNGRAAGQDVFHAHLHITPRQAGDGYYKFGGKVRVPDEDEVRKIENDLQEAAKTILENA